MSFKSSKEFLQTALTNNTFDPTILDRELHDSLENSFSSLYRLQRNMIPYDEFFFVSNQEATKERRYGFLFLNEHEKVCIEIPTTVVSETYREAYRNSKFFDVEFTYEELKNHKEIFNRIPIVSIDNQIIQNFSLHLSDDHFKVIFPFRKDFIYKESFNTDYDNYDYIEHHVTVQVIPNIFTTSIVTNTAMLKANSYDKKSFDRILYSYFTQSGGSLNKNKNYKGLYFAVVYKGSDPKGSSLQDVTIDENNDILIHYDKQVLESLKNYSGSLKIEFFFYKDLYSYESYKYKKEDYDSINVPIYPYNGKARSEVVLLRDKDKELFSSPIATENLFILRNCIDPENGKFLERKQIPNSSIHINYPNIYQLTENGYPGESIRIYFFYVPAYNLGYRYMYQFYYKYLEYKWGNDIEKTINDIYFGKWEEESNESIRDKNLVGIAFNALLLQKGNYIDVDTLGSFYQYTINHFQESKSIEDIKEEFLSNIEVNTDSSNFIPTEILESATIFDYVINHEIVEYRFDEFDYTDLKKDGESPIDYKAFKMKKFIGDNIDILRNYIISQNNVGIKYEFSAADINLPSRIRESSQSSGRKFVEPMYLFQVEKPDPRQYASARIYVNGLLIVDFIYERLEYKDHIYIPVDSVPDGNPYFELEVFNSFKSKKSLFFTKEKPYVDVSYEEDDIAVTFSDLFFYLGNSFTANRLNIDNFKIEILNDRYVYPIPGSEEVGITHEIIRDKDPVEFREIVAGASTIKPNDTDVLFTFMKNFRVTCLNEELFNQEITLEVDKTDSFHVIHSDVNTYQDIFISGGNIGDLLDYIRVYRNGRLICRNRYSITENDMGIRLITLERIDKGESLAVDITPYRNKLLMYKECVVDTTKPLDFSDVRIDLRGYINKPFDTRYYEVFMNGRRISQRQICPISPWEIRIGNCNSLFNFELYEKDRDWEYFGVNDFTPYFTLSDLIRMSFLKNDEEIKKALIRDLADLEDNRNREDKEPWDIYIDMQTILFEMFYYKELVPLKLANPMELQFNNEYVRNNYKVIHEHFYEHNDKGEGVYLLNPDVFYEPENGTGEWDVYKLGNGDLEKELENDNS